MKSLIIKQCFCGCPFDIPHSKTVWTETLQTASLETGDAELLTVVLFKCVHIQDEQFLANTFMYIDHMR